MKFEELPRWTEEPFDDTKYIPIEFIEMVKKLCAENETYYRNINETEMADMEHHFHMCLISLLREWENNRPADHFGSVD